MILTKYSELKKIRRENSDKKIVFCSGTFDLTHAGHVLFFEDSRKVGDLLVVTVGSDAMIKKNKGDKRPILNEHLRLKLVSSLKPVDYCLLEMKTKDHPLQHLEYTFKDLRPDIYVINQDAFDIPFRKKLAKKYKIKLVVLNRWCPPEYDNISTTKIIEKIKNI